jgi:hypothetical protein
MIESFLALKDEVGLILLLTHRPDLLISELKWVALAGTRYFLKPSDDITRYLSSQSYLSLSKVILSVRYFHIIKPTPHNTELDKLIKDLRIKDDNITSRFDIPLRKLARALVTTYLNSR